MKKLDIYLILGVLVAAGFFYVLFSQGHRQTDTVTVYVKGAYYKSYSLKEEQTITIKTDRGSNVLEIKDHTVRMKEADCPDRYCVRHGVLKDGTDSIVCLPHQVVVQYEESDGGSYDAITN